MTYINHYRGIRKQARRTPRDFFEKLDQRFGFTLDGAATPKNALLPLFCIRASANKWKGERVFCNPPWSSIAEFVEFAPAAEMACFLVPARTNCGWFHRALELGAKPEFFKGRLRFDQFKTTAPVDCLLLIFGGGGCA